MKRKRLITLLLLLIFVLFITKNQRISSSPDSLSKIDEQSQFISDTDRELDEMKHLFSNFDEWLNAEIESTGTVGGAVAIIYKDKIAYQKCFGVRKTGTADSVDEHTVFRLASVSKTFTGVLSGILVQENKLDFNECVKEILPDFKLNRSLNTDSLTIRNLLTHTSGLTPHAYDDLVESHVPFNTILTRLKHAAISANPGKAYSYQNVMFSLMDTILTLKTDMNFDRQIREKIFNPLDMSDASTGFQSFRDNENKAWPHGKTNTSYQLLPLNNRYYSTAPAAGVNASISDMSKYTLALLDNENPLLGDSVSQIVFEPQIVTPLSRGYFKYWDDIDLKSYGLGWRLIDYKGRKIACHSGYVRGYKSEIVICRQENIGFVYLTNSPDAVASQSAPVFLNSFFNYRSTPVIITDVDTLEEDSVITQGS